MTRFLLSIFNTGKKCFSLSSEFLLIFLGNSKFSFLNKNGVKSYSLLSLIFPIINFIEDICPKKPSNNVIYLNFFNLTFSEKLKFLSVNLKSAFILLESIRKSIIFNFCSIQFLFKSLFLISSSLIFIRHDSSFKLDI